jgi:hypothetical protein
MSRQPLPDNAFDRACAHKQWPGYDDLVERCAAQNAREQGLKGWQEKLMEAQEQGMRLCVWLEFFFNCFILFQPKLHS